MTTVTCVYCGQEYPDGTPTSQDELLYQHIQVCEKHPMAKEIKERDRLRATLQIYAEHHRWARWFEKGGCMVFDDGYNHNGWQLAESVLNELLEGK